MSRRPLAPAARAVARLRADPPIVRPRAHHACVLAPHPDDEVLLCGGTIIRLVESGARVSVVHVTDGEATLAPGRRASLARHRRREARRACTVLGVRDVLALGLADGGLSRSLALTAEITRVLERLRPDLVIAPWHGDAPGDHAAVARALDAALAASSRSPTPRAWSGETWRPLEPDGLVDTTAVRSRQRAAAACHVTPRRVLDLDAGLALHRYRGWAALGGHGTCEAFVMRPPPVRRGPRRGLPSP